MEQNDVICEQKFFAAANSYNGFISYFNSVFPSNEYSRIFVLKGGPGTGKSSFMKKISNAFSKPGYKNEAIYCSSDPSSLDGVIVQNGKSKVAIIDGTAPHERDAVIPGAIDEILNLGNLWEEKWLIADKERILSLANEKSSAYKTAYSYLSLAGTAKDKINDVLSKFTDTKKLKSIAKSIAESQPSDEDSYVSTRLISSFGRYGKKRLDTLENCAKHLLSINADSYAAMLLMNEVCKELQYNGTNFIHFPSALDTNLCEAIYIPSTETAIVINSIGEKIDIEDCILRDKLDTERMKVANEIHDRAISEAARWFSIAADLHFRLEEIYTRTMNFENIDAMYNKTVEKIDNILKT